jgi:preprotein translocase subunit SecD
MAKITLRIWILIICLVLALFAINPLGYFEKGLIVKSVKTNSTAAQAGLSPGEILKEINGKTILTMSDYSEAVSSISIQPVNFTITADKGTFTYQSLTIDFSIDDNLTINFVTGNALKANVSLDSVLLKINDINISSRHDFEKALELEPKEKFAIKTNKQEYIMLVNAAPDIVVSDIPKTRLKTGLDLQGGSKALVRPERKLSQSEMNDLLLVSQERLNVYGISDVSIRKATDLSGETYMLVEVAGLTPSELEELIGKQGKFEARIGNETVFVGGSKHITSVCRNDATCSGVRQCLPSQQGYACRFEFAVYLSEEAAARQANATSKLSENITSEGKKILSETLDLYLDDNLVDSLQIAADLKGRAVTQVAISGPGEGKTKLEAFDNAEKNMAKLQTVLITGSLPFKLEIVKLDSISPLLGKEFTSNIILASLAAMLAVSICIFIRYKRPMLAIPIIFTMLAEAFLTLGVAAAINWNLDLASIAGLIAAIGTGVDDQIVIIDESRISRAYGWKERMKRAFFIIMSAFSIVTVAMIPLWWAGAGMLRGFALTTIVGIIVGVFITRPAFSDFINIFVKEEQ